MENQRKVMEERSKKGETWNKVCEVITAEVKKRFFAQRQTSVFTITHPRDNDKCGRDTVIIRLFFHFLMIMNKQQ